MSKVLSKEPEMQFHVDCAYLRRNRRPTWTYLLGDKHCCAYAGAKRWCIPKSVAVSDKSSLYKRAKSKNKGRAISVQRPRSRGIFIKAIAMKTVVIKF